MSQIQIVAAVLIFAVVYGVIAFSKIPRLRLDRPGAAICGAVLMVVCGVLSFDEAWQAIDARTITLLLGMMILNAFLEESGFFELAAARVLGHAASPIRLLVGLTILSAALSALVLNDAACLMLTAPVLSIVRAGRLRPGAYLIALAMSANIGSVMTVIGNPQNMLIASYSGWSYVGFLLWMAPVGIVGTAALVGLLLLFYGSRLRIDDGAPANDPRAELPALRVDRRLMIESLVVLAGVTIGFIASNNLSVVALAGGAVLLLISHHAPAKVLARVDWVLLTFFAGLFVVVRGMEQTGLVVRMAEAVRPMYGSTMATQIPVFSLVTVAASNVVSNVPFVVLARGIVPQLVEPQLMWLVLSMASTFAGNLTIPGSVATLIVLETARRQPEGGATIGFFEFLRIGIPVTLLTTTLGAGILAAEHAIAAAWQP